MGRANKRMRRLAVVVWRAVLSVANRRLGGIPMNALRTLLLTGLFAGLWEIDIGWTAAEASSSTVGDMLGGLVTCWILLTFLWRYRVWSDRRRRRLLSQIESSTSTSSSDGPVFTPLEITGSRAAAAAEVGARVIAAKEGREVMVVEGEEMVHWFTFFAFLDAAFYTLLPSVLDMREKYAPGGEREGSLEVFSFKKKKKDDDDEEEGSGGTWLDFVADTGDGFNATFAVARLLAQPRLTVKEGDGSDVVLPRGRVLMHGGDLYYPYPGEKQLRTRFFRPYELALPEGSSSTVAEDPVMLILPGNHEWLDNNELFEEKCLDKSVRDCIGGWSLPQTQPYWAAELDHGWWIFGCDMGGEEDLDDAQLEYFEDIIRSRMGKDSACVVITHIPWWVKNYMGWEIGAKGLARLHRSLGTRLALCLAGDLHYYMRHEPTCRWGTNYTPRHRSASDAAANVGEDGKAASSSLPAPAPAPPMFIIQGGGGGFKHSPANPDVSKLSVKRWPPWGEGEGGTTYEIGKSYPTPEESRTFFKSTVWCIFRKSGKRYGHVLGFLYCWGLTASTHPDIINSCECDSDRGCDGVSFAPMAWRMITSSFAWLSFVVLTIIHLVFTLANRPRRHLPVGTFLALFHSALHMAFAGVVRAVLASALCAAIRPGDAETIDRPAEIVASVAGANLVMYATGYFLAPFVSVVYFYFTFLYCGQHWNEAYCILEDQDRNSFSKLHVRPDGDLEFYALAVPRAPRRWIPAANDPDRAPWDPSAAVEATGETLSCELIEKVLIRHPARFVEQEGAVARTTGCCSPREKTL